MARAIKPKGTNPLAPSAWRPIVEWRREDIPAFPGTYEIRHAPDGKPIERQIRDTILSQIGSIRQNQEKANQLELSSVIYIGKAVCFRDRFWNLIETWQRADGDRNSKRNHGSYQTWLNKNLQVEYPITDLEFRYMPVSQEVWRPKIETYIDELRAALMKQDGNSPDNQAGAAAFSQENSLLNKYIDFYGEIPPLNILGPQTKRMPEADMQAHLEDLGKPLALLDEEEEGELSTDQASSATD